MFLPSSPYNISSQQKFWECANKASSHSHRTRNFGQLKLCLIKVWTTIFWLPDLEYCKCNFPTNPHVSQKDQSTDLLLIIQFYTSIYHVLRYQKLIIITYSTNICLRAKFNSVTYLRQIVIAYEDVLIRQKHHTCVNPMFN